MKIHLVCLDGSPQHFNHNTQILLLHDEVATSLIQVSVIQLLVHSFEDVRRSLVHLG